MKNVKLKTKLIFALLIFVVGSALHAAEEKNDDKESNKWDVNNPPGESYQANIDVTEGTWMNVDVSPDGKTILFDLLGDLYTLPIKGGEATSITHSIAWEMQGKFSPDGKKIAFTSDQGGGDNIWIMDIDGTIFDVEELYVNQPFAFVLSKNHQPLFDYQLTRAETYEIRLKDFEHISFTDHLLWWQWDHDDYDLGMGNIDSHRAVELTTQLVDQFFGHYLSLEDRDGFENIETSRLKRTTANAEIIEQFSNSRDSAEVRITRIN